MHRNRRTAEPLIGLERELTLDPGVDADVEMVGTERIMVNSAGDWGKSDPMAVPEFIQEMKRRGQDDAVIEKIVYHNPLNFWRQANNWVEGT